MGDNLFCFPKSNHNLLELVQWKVGLRAEKVYL